MKKRELPRHPSKAVGVEVTLFPWHLERLDAWAAEQGVSRSELVRQMVLARHREGDSGNGQGDKGTR